MRVMAGRSISYFQIEPINNTYSLQAKPIPDVFEYFRNYRKRIAPIEEGAPNFDAITEPHRNLILKAVEIVRRDPYCELILDTYISNSKGTLSNPVFYVTYERSDGVTKNYFISKSEIESTDISS